MFKLIIVSSYRGVHLMGHNPRCWYSSSSLAQMTYFLWQLKSYGIYPRREDKSFLQYCHYRTWVYQEIQVRWYTLHIEEQKL